VEQIVVAMKILLIRRGRHRLLEAPQLGFDLPQLGERLLHRLPDRPLGVQSGDLWQVGDPWSPDRADLSFGRRLLAADEPEQRRLADAVVSDQRNPIAAGDLS